ncbi:MAG: 2-succinyl-5-enolpyruvyl-6-hydroxy-3-cyclohexene-1-carboxylate synthase, partial [Haloarculaceae archaeon]
FDPPFTEQFKTPHGLDFAPTGELYDLEFATAGSRGDFVDRFEESLDREGTQVLEVETDSEASHRFREQLHDRVCDAI